MKKYIMMSLFLVFIILITGCDSKEAQIRKQVVGTELTSISHDLKEQIGYVKEEDIMDIELVECGWVGHELVEDNCYRVSIGKNKDEIFWYIFYDKYSLEQIKIEQSFVT